jgi:hypothetical protein
MYKSDQVAPALVLIGSVQGGKISILGDHSISHSKQRVYM